MNATVGMALTGYMTAARVGPVRNAGGGRAGAVLVSGGVFRFQRAALSRKALRGAWHPLQLHVYQGLAARCGVGAESAKTRHASAQARAAADDRDAAAYRRQHAPLARRRAVARPAGGSG